MCVSAGMYACVGDALCDRCDLVCICVGRCDFVHVNCEGEGGVGLAYCSVNTRVWRSALSDS